MLKSLITSKTRVKLLLKFFINPLTKAYLRELAKELDVSTNSIRLELNRLEKSNLLLTIILTPKIVSANPNNKFALCLRFNKNFSIIKVIKGAKVPRKVALAIVVSFIAPKNKAKWKHLENVK